MKSKKQEDLEKEEVSKIVSTALIPKIKSHKLLVAVAGGVTPDKTLRALKSGADIIVVGRYITASKDVDRAAQDFLDFMEPDPDIMRLPLDEDESTLSSPNDFSGTFSVGEALIGIGAETAHVDLVIGDKNSPVGTAFVNAISQPRKGHTPLLALIRPNLLAKPATLMVPKVTIHDMEVTEKIFGPAQTAVGRAVADAVAEGIIPQEKAEELVIIASVYVHPQAADYRKIYQFNYAATKLSLQRALNAYPNMDKVLSEKDRSIHPLMGYKVNRLWDPPYLQVALDLDSLDEVEEVINSLPVRERVLIEAGTPLIKKFGVGIIGRIRKIRNNSFIIADLKTLDTGRIEVKMAADETADAVTISGQASIETITKSIDEARKQGVYSILDMMNVSDVLSTLEKLPLKPDVVLLHQNIDQQGVD